MAMEAKGDQLMHEGAAALKKWSLFGGTEKYEDAADKFQRAGHAFKAGKAWASAAKAYESAAKAFQSAKSESDVATCFIEAARAHIKAGDAKTATELLETEALPRMVDAGRLSQAAKLHQEVAEMMEDEGQFEGAMDNYQKSADLFNAENAGSTASKCLAKIGHIAAQCDPPDFERAAAVFASVGADCLNSNLLKFSAKGYFFCSTICTLARGDIVAAEGDLNKFKEQDYTFSGACPRARRPLVARAPAAPPPPRARRSPPARRPLAARAPAAPPPPRARRSPPSAARPPAARPPARPPAGSRECKLLDDLCAAFKDGSVDAFTDAVYSYDQISKLDPWKTSVLLKVKQSIQKASGQGDDLT